MIVEKNKSLDLLVNVRGMQMKHQVYLCTADILCGIIEMVMFIVTVSQRLNCYCLFDEKYFFVDK